MCVNPCARQPRVHVSVQHAVLLNIAGHALAHYCFTYRHTAGSWPCDPKAVNRQDLTVPLVRPIGSTRPISNYLCQTMSAWHVYVSCMLVLQMHALTRPKYAGSSGNRS